MGGAAGCCSCPQHHVTLSPRVPPAAQGGVSAQPQRLREVKLPPGTARIIF